MKARLEDPGSQDPWSPGLLSSQGSPGLPGSLQGDSGQVVDATSAARRAATANPQDRASGQVAAVRFLKIKPADQIRVGSTRVGSDRRRRSGRAVATDGVRRQEARALAAPFLDR